MSLYGSIDNIYLTRDVMGVILFWLPESEWYLLKLNKSLLRLMNTLYKDYPIDVLARGGHIESLEHKCKVENVMPRVFDVCSCGNLKVVKRFLDDKMFDNFWGFSVGGNPITRMARAFDLKQPPPAGLNFDDIFRRDAKLTIDSMVTDMVNTMDCGLQGACISGCIEVIEYMLKKCPLNDMDDRPLKYALLGAFKSENPTVVDYMIAKGANLNATLSLACTFADKESCKKIVAKGADTCAYCMGQQH